MRFEAYDEAVNETAPQWYDDEIGIKVRAWNLLQFRKTDDKEALKFAFEIGQSMVPDIEKAIKQRLLTPQFILDWGLFCEHAGLIKSAYLATGHDVIQDQQAVAGAKSSKDSHLKWYLHCRRNLIEDGYSTGTKEANSLIFECITKIVSREVKLDPPFENIWFEGLFSKKSLKKIKSNTSEDKPSFSSVIKNNTNNDRAKKLLEQEFSQGIQIPSINLEDYY